MRSVAESFESYRQAVIPDAAPVTQVEECRRAFYAGAYFLLIYLATSFDDATPDEEGIAALERLKAECEAFAANLQPSYTFPDAPAAPSLRQAPDISYTAADPDDIKPLLQELGGVIGAALPAGYGFNLLLFTFAPGGVFYIANAERADVINMMREFIKKQVS